MQANESFAFWCRRVGETAVPFGSGNADANILVIDGDPVMGAMLARTLTSDSRHTRYVSNADEGLTLIATWKPAVIILTIGDTGREAFDTAALLRRDPRSHDAALIAYTALSESAVRTRGLVAGFDAYCHSGVSHTLLLSVIATLLV